MSVAGCTAAVGGQDCHAAASGAHTGDLSAEMLKDAGAAAVIVGHSERRADHGERDADVRAKARGRAARRADWRSSASARRRASARPGSRSMSSARQLAGSLPTEATAADTVIAYEPVWAIGTGLTPTAADVAEVHAHHARGARRSARRRGRPRCASCMAARSSRRTRAELMARRRCQRRAGRRRQPQGRRFPRHHRGVPEIGGRSR